MKILVTGATGFIGSSIVEELAKQGLAIRAAHRPGESLGEIDSDFLIDGLDLESFPLDLNNRKEVFTQLKGIQILFHADYFCSWKSQDKNRLYEINQMGTRNLMEAAHAQGVEKVVYTSGMETLALPQGNDMATERDGVAWEDLKTHFEKSRFLAEREVLNFKGKGLPVVMVHPTICLGARERGSTLFGQYLQRLLRGKARFYLDTGFNLVDVVDVAKGHLLAAKRGKMGGRYILGNQNVYMLEILQKVSQMTGLPAPKTALPFRWAQLGNLLVRRMPGSLLKKLKKPLFFDTSLARQELGFPQSNIWDALARQIQNA